MRLNFAILVLLAAAGGLGCSAADAPAMGRTDDLGGGGGERTFTYDLSHHDPGQTPPSLTIANQTLVFPVDLTQPAVRTPSVTAPDDLLAIYTRVGCWVDPEGWIGRMGAVPVTLTAHAPARLDEVTVEHAASPSVTASLTALATATCVSLRSPAGVWQPFEKSSQVVLTADSVRVTFALAGVSADAVAIFLPTYTSISRVAYRAQAGP